MEGVAHEPPRVIRGARRQITAGRVCLQAPPADTALNCSPSPHAGEPGVSCRNRPWEKGVSQPSVSWVPLGFVVEEATRFLPGRPRGSAPGTHNPQSCVGSWLSQAGGEEVPGTGLAARHRAEVHTGACSRPAWGSCRVLSAVSGCAGHISSCDLASACASWLHLIPRTRMERASAAAVRPRSSLAPEWCLCGSRCREQCFRGRLSSATLLSGGNVGPKGSVAVAAHPGLRPYSGLETGTASTFTA